MRLAFNATSLLSPLTGIGQYSFQLALGLAKQTEIDADFFYGAAWSKKVRETPLAGPTSFMPFVRAWLPYSYELRRWVQGNRFAAHVKGDTFDVYHEPNILPLPFDGPTVITVHDISWVRYPGAHPAERVRAMNKHFQPGLDRASLILTDSEFIKRELIEVFGVQPERICPIALGVEERFKPKTATETLQTLGAHSLAYQQYILAVGTLEPRKNLTLAITAFMQLAPNLRAQFPLVLVGMKGWHTSALEKLMAPLVAAGDIRLLGYLPREQLADVIAGATVLVYPSIYEGFGLPPLEAMACGVPVIASNASSIPEVVGDSGILVHPQDQDAMLYSLNAILNAPDIRTKLAHKALSRSTQFTWSRCVSQTIGAYGQALNKA